MNEFKNFSYEDEEYLPNLPYHLIKAGQDDDLHKLLCDETEQGSNEWYQFRESHGQEVGYLTDVDSAWQLAEKAFNNFPSHSISLQCRYALIISSLNSVVKHIPTALLAVLLEKQVWTPSQGLAYIRQMVSMHKTFSETLNNEPLNIANEMAQAIVALAPYLPSESLLTESLILLQTVEDVEFLEGLIPYLKKLYFLQKVLTMAKGIEDEAVRANIIKVLIPHLPEPLLAEVLTTVRTSIKSAKRQVQLLSKLVFHLTGVLQTRAFESLLEMIQIISNPEDRVKILTELISQLPETQCKRAIEEAIAAVHAIEDVENRAQVLIELIPYLSETQQKQIIEETITATFMIRDAEKKTQVLKTLIRYFPLSEAQQEQVCEKAILAVRVIENNFSQQSLKWWANVSANFEDLAIRLAQEHEDKYVQALELAYLIPYLPEVLQKRLFKETLPLIQAIKTKRIDALLTLISLLPETLAMELFTIIKTIEDANSLVKVLTALALRLPQPLQVGVLEEALARARSIRDGVSRTNALTEIAPHLPQPLQIQVLEETVITAQTIEDSKSRANALVVLVPYLPQNRQEQILEKLLEVATTIEYPDYRARWLTQLIPNLSSTLRGRVLKEILAAIREIKPSSGGSEITWESERSELIVKIAPYLSKPFLQEALLTVRSINDTDKKAELLSKMAAYLPETLLQEVLITARTIRDTSERTEALARIIPHLSKLLQGQVIEETLALGHSIGSSIWWINTLIEISSLLSEKFREMVLTEALAVARSLDKTSAKVKALINLYSYLPQRKQVFLEVLEILKTIQQESELVAGLSELAPLLPSSLLPDALTIARSIQNTDYQVLVLVQLLPYSSDASLEDVLSLAHTIKQDSERTKALAQLASHLPDSLQEQVFKEVMATVRIIPANERVEVITNLLDYLPVPLRDELCIEAIAMTLETQTLLTSIKISRFIRFLPESLLQNTLKYVREIKYNPTRTIALSELAHRLATLSNPSLVNLWLEKQNGDNLLHFLSHRSRNQLFSDLGNLIPLLALLGSEECIIELFRAIQDVNRWWP